MAGTLNVPNTFATQSGNVPASQLDDNNTTIETYVNAREISTGTVAARPAAGTSGRYYFATDVNGGTLYLDTGSTWLALTAGNTVIAGSVPILGQSGATVVSPGATRFFVLGFHDATQVNAAIVLPTSGTLRNLYVFGTASPGVGQTYTITVMLNGGASVITTTLSGAASTGSDLVNSVGVAAADSISFRVVSSAGANAGAFAASVVLQP